MPLTRSGKHASVSSSNSYGLPKGKASALNRTTTLGPIRSQKFVAFTYLKAGRRLNDDSINFQNYSLFVFSNIILRFFVHEAAVTPFFVRDMTPICHV
ncbi:unnamed protein product [Hymenolepis diminuta]|uniref:Uncharacterized protein n=1 Tax=Hymenolepis diminuta TaxID=6216 RepID=A0A564Y420_HYMDI|nr:unnamed protein product [Hymenolepis diminuta]